MNVEPTVKLPKPVSELWNGIDWVRTSGTPREAGRQHGEALRPLAHFLYRALSRLDHHQLTPQRKEQLRARAEWLNREFPSELEEIHGISETTDLDPLLILVLCHQLGRRFPRPEDEASTCTGAVFRNTSRGTICGNTMDDGSPHFIHVHEGPGWVRHVTVQFAGIAGGFGGMNEHGLYLGDASGGVGFDRPLPASPQHSVPSLTTLLLILRYCRTVKDAIALLRRPEVLGHGNHLIADAQGNVVVVEKYTTDGPREVCIAEQTCAMGNLSLADLRADPVRLKAERPQSGSPIWGPIWGRYLSVKHLIETTDRPDVERMKSILRSHHQELPEYPRSSVCNAATALALIGVPQERRLFVVGSPPCQHPFREVQFTDKGITIQGELE